MKMFDNFVNYLKLIVEFRTLFGADGRAEAGGRSQSVGMLSSCLGSLARLASLIPHLSAHLHAIAAPIFCDRGRLVPI